MKYKTKPGLATGVIIALVVATTAVVGGGVYLATRSDDSNQAAQNQTETSEQTDSTSEPADANQSSLALYKNAVDSDVQIRCDYTDADGNDGTAYVDSETRIRVDGNTPDQGPVHFIRDGDTYYTWFDNDSTGFKVTLEGNNNLPEQYESFSEENFEQAQAESNVSVECEEDSLDDGLFSPPSNINFQAAGNIQLPS